MKSVVKLNNEVKIDLPTLIVSRLLVQANSGGGKSWLIRRIVEQAYGKVQIIILDPEGEFSTLREKYDFVLAGKGGDTVAEPRSATLLATRLLGWKVSAVIDLYELPPQERKHFVRLFLESMVNAPKGLWHPVLVVIDEAHVFCPEKDQSEAASAVIDLATRGRKRRFCAVLATQRIAKLSKDASAECNNKLIGRSSQDVDMKRAAYELGFTKPEDVLSLRKMKPGEFYAFGPAISDEVQRLKIGGVNTTHHLKAGSQMKVVPPTEGIKKLLGKLADLPKEAEEEARTVSELKAEIVRLKRQASTFSKKVEPPRQEVVDSAVEVARRSFEAERVNLVKKLKPVQDAVDKIFNLALSARKLFVMPPFQPHVTKKPDPASGKDAGKITGFFPTPTSKLTPDSAPLHSNIAYRASVIHPGGITTPERRILNAIAWLENVGIEEPEKTAVAFLADYTFGSGGFNNPCGSLRTKGLIHYRGRGIVLTDEGRRLADAPTAPLTNEEMHKHVLGVLDKPHQRILIPLLRAYPESLADEALAEASGYKAGTGGFNNPKGKLRTLGLIEYPSPRQSRARAILFPEA